MDEYASETGYTQFFFIKHAFGEAFWIDWTNPFEALQLGKSALQLPLKRHGVGGMEALPCLHEALIDPLSD
jgi:hypothetical protein